MDIPDHKADPNKAASLVLLRPRARLQAHYAKELP